METSARSRARSPFPAIWPGVLALLVAGGALAAGGTDPGACGPTSNPCKVKSLQTAPVGFGSLPTCDARRRATIQGTTDAGYRACDNGVWGPLGGGGQTDTCTGAGCSIGPGGITSDGGITSTGTVHSLQSGPGTIAFQCDDQISSSSPCLANGSAPSSPLRTLEIFSFMDYPNDGGSVNIVGPNVLLSARPSPLDGGVRAEGYLFSILNNETAAFGVDYSGNIDIDRAGGGAQVRMWGTSNNVIATQIANKPLTVESIAGSNPVMYIFSAVAQAATDDALSIYNGGATTDVFDVTNQGFTRQHGVATGSLVTCNAGNAGLRGWNTTTSSFWHCSGSGWVDEAPLSSFAWTSFCTSCSTDTNFLAPMLATAGALTVSRASCSWGTAGTGGSSAATFQVYDATSSASVGTCSLGACNTAAFTPMTCTLSAGALTAGHLIAGRISSKGDCTVAPQNIGCTTLVSP